MSELEKLSKLQLRQPNGLKKFVFEKTDYQTRNTKKVPRFVETIEVWNGKLLLRTFGFISNSTGKTKFYKDIQIREVHRQLEGHNKCMLRDVWCNMNGHRVNFDEHYQDKNFWINDLNWNFYSYQMYDKKEVINQLNIPYCQYNNELNHSQLSFFEYICRYRKEPKIELLVKAGLSQYISGLRYLNLKAKTLENIFKVESKFVPMLRDMNVSQLLIVRKYPFLNTFDDINIIQNIKDRKYIMKFLNSRMFKFICQNDISISIYNDYLRFCDELGMDMNSSKVLFPIDYKEKHDTLMNQIKVLRSEKQDKLIKEQFDKHKKYAFENSLFIIYPVSSTQQLIDESKELNHCVRTYAEKVAMKQTEIMFVRNVNKKEKPLYTLELKGKKVIQFRGKNNSVPKQDAIDFIKQWSKKNNFECSL